jgi:hypothetical protein
VRRFILLARLSGAAECAAVGGGDPARFDLCGQMYVAGKTVPHIKEVPGWNAHLASDAEAVVKAEREVSGHRCQFCILLVNCCHADNAVPLYRALIARWRRCRSIRWKC